MNTFITRLRALTETDPLPVEALLDLCSAHLEDSEWLATLTDRERARFQTFVQKIMDMVKAAA